MWNAEDREWHRSAVAAELENGKRGVYCRHLAYWRNSLNRLTVCMQSIICISRASSTQLSVAYQAGVDRTQVNDINDDDACGQPARTRVSATAAFIIGSVHIASESC